jgi:hypothetical protein
MSTRIVPTKAQLAQFLAIVNDPAAQPVYVHCVGGRHRTGVMTAAYRMTHEGWTGDKAFQEMKQYKFGADFLHPEFKQFVYGFRPEKPAVNAENVVLVAPDGNGERLRSDFRDRPALVLHSQMFDASIPAAFWRPDAAMRLMRGKG